MGKGKIAFAGVITALASVCQSEPATQDEPRVPCCVTRAYTGTAQSACALSCECRSLTFWHWLPHPIACLSPRSPTAAEKRTSILSPMSLLLYRKSLGVPRASSIAKRGYLMVCLGKLSPGTLVAWCGKVLLGLTFAPCFQPTSGQTQNHWTTDYPSTKSP